MVSLTIKILWLIISWWQICDNFFFFFFFFFSFLLIDFLFSCKDLAFCICIAAGEKKYNGKWIHFQSREVTGWGGGGGAIWLAPFQGKVYDWPHFSGLVYERPHFSDVSRYMHISFVQKFYEAAFSLHTRWIDCNICIFLWARYMNGVGFEILAQKPVPQLLPSYPPPPGDK